MRGGTEEEKERRTDTNFSAWRVDAQHLIVGRDNSGYNSSAFSRDLVRISDHIFGCEIRPVSVELMEFTAERSDPPGFNSFVEQLLPEGCVVPSQ